MRWGTTFSTRGRRCADDDVYAEHGGPRTEIAADVLVQGLRIVSSEAANCGTSQGAEVFRAISGEPQEGERMIGLEAPAEKVKFPRDLVTAVLDELLLWFDPEPGQRGSPAARVDQICAVGGYRRRKEAMKD